MTDTLLESIIADAEASRERRILLPVPLESREVALLCRTLTQEEIADARKLGKKLAPKNDSRASLLMSKQLLAVATLEIWHKDVPLEGADGEPLTFNDDELQRRAKVADRLDAVEKIVGRDGDMEIMSDALIEQSGYDKRGYVLPEVESPT